MSTVSSSPPLTKAVIARIPYLNCAPFFRGLTMPEPWESVELSPRELGARAKAGEIVAGPMSLVDYHRMQDQFERVGHLGVAVHGRSGSALLFSRKPMRQLERASVALTDESSTTSLLLRIILECRYELEPNTYVTVPAGELGAAHQQADAVLVIGDEALRFRATNRRYAYETDVSFEWWLWQHLPFVFAVWVIRKDADPQDKERVSRAIFRALAINQGQLGRLAQEWTERLKTPAADLRRYLDNFVYRLGSSEEQAIEAFTKLVHANHLL